MELTTPALLFPAISLLLLAYTNRFLVLAQLIRQLHGQNRSEIRDVTIRQISNLRRRILLVKLMQGAGVCSFLFCTLTMLSIFLEMKFLAEVLFGFSLFLLVVSLFLSLYEVVISTDAINMELEDLERHKSPE